MAIVINSAFDLVAADRRRIAFVDDIDRRFALQRGQAARPFFPVVAQFEQGFVAEPRNFLGAGFDVGVKFLRRVARFCEMHEIELQSGMAGAFESNRATAAFLRRLNDRIGGKTEFGGDIVGVRSPCRILRAAWLRPRAPPTRRASTRPKRRSAQRFPCEPEISWRAILYGDELA